MKLILFVVVFVCSIMGGLAQIMLKKGMDLFAFETILSNWQLATGIFLYGMAFIFYNISLKFGDVTKLYPIIALSYIWVVLFASFMLNEPITYKNIVGSLMIVTGIWVIL